MTQRSSTHTAAEFEVRFESLFNEGRGFAFPCDPDGHVDLDTVSERARNNYLFARAMVGREYAVPMVCPLALH
jgi:hypothetical protein